MKRSLATLRDKSAAIALALTLAAGFTACGESGAKRAVDARAEAVSFFAQDAPVVALLRPRPPGDLVELNRVAANLPAWRGLREMVLGPLHDAGLSAHRLLRLTRPSEEIEDIDASALALGAPRPRDLADGRELLVLATDQPELLSRYLREGASVKRLRRAGSLDGAALYSGSDFAFAVRDGVLVSAPSVPEVRAAVRRRDGDRDERIDDGVVDSLFQNLDDTGPLLIYADLREIRESDPGLEQLNGPAPWTAKLGPTGASARVENSVLEIEDFSKASGGDLSSDELPLGAKPSNFVITAQSAAVLISAGPVRDLLLGLVPIAGEATATSDEVRLHVTVGG